MNAISRILETEGWECLNLGGNIPFEAMAEMVEQEPVNLVCVVSSNPQRPLEKSFGVLSEAANNYRIPIVLTGPGFAEPEIRLQFPHEEYSPDFRSFQATSLAELSPHFSHQVVAKRRKDRSDKAREGYPLTGRPRKRTLEYVEKGRGVPACGSRNAVRAYHCADAVDLV